MQTTLDEMMQTAEEVLNAGKMWDGRFLEDLLVKG